MVDTAANPPGGLARIGHKKGFDPQRITFPFNINTARVMRYISREFMKRIGERYFEEFPDLDLLNHIERYCVVGLHGMPFFASSSPIRNFLDVPAKSWGEGEKQARLQMLTGIKNHEAAREMFKWFEDASKYRKQPRATCYAYDASLGSYVALPVEMVFPKGGAMYQTIKEIKEIDLRRDTLAPDYADFDFARLDKPVFELDLKLSLRELVAKHNRYYDAVERSLGLVV